MILITSAAYVGQELASEFGRLPPSFLPVGNKRLFNYQIAQLTPGNRIVLTIPEGFQISGYDQEKLDDLGVEVLPIPEGLSLGESVVCAMNLSGHPPAQPVRILHGDTLISDLPTELDVITLSEVDDNYRWAAYDRTGNTLLVELAEADLTRTSTDIADGFFSFSDSGLLVRSLIHANGNFVSGINRYAREKPLQPVKSERWLDFGHIHTFYRSRSQMTTQRAFNDMVIGPKTVRKTSANAQKMHAESAWFQMLPGELRIYTPHFVRELSDNENAGYEIEYLYLTALNDLYVFGALPSFVWKTILSACMDFLAGCARHRITADEPELSADHLFLKKTLSRLEKFAQNTGTSIDAEWRFNDRRVPGLVRIAEETASIIRQTDTQTCVMHGDFCFSNILFDFRTQLIKAVDPRGLDAEDHPTIYGPQSYDVAKLAHSVVGLYDFIIAGHYKLQQSANNIELILPDSDVLNRTQSLFGEMVSSQFGFSRPEINAMQTQLFLSMLPLHHDDHQRQQALMANGLRLYMSIKT